MKKGMRIAGVFLFLFFVDARAEIITTTIPSRKDFPSGFVFGAGTSAYQVEGAAAEDGRKPSIWDTYAHLEKNIGKGTGDIASDQYHHYKEDVKLMHKMGLDAYRFSISWSRLIPDGRGAVNPKGLKYYNDLINGLVNHGIETHVTLNHFDIPQCLQDEYEGYLSPVFIEDFTAYVDVCFREFGDRVNSWSTFNEPNTQFGFTRCFSPFDKTCSNGDLQRETYIPGHNILLAHAAAVDLYRTKYQEKQKGRIGITLIAVWYLPLSNSPGDVHAVARERAFLLDWFMEPLVYGRYPAIMRKIAGSQLPKMTDKDAAQIQGSFDFIGINHYYGLYAHADDYNYRTRAFAPRNRRYGVNEFNRPFAPGVYLQNVLEYIKVNYRNPAVLIHENGYADDSSSSALQNDTARISYLEAYIQSLLLSIRNGSNVSGYFVWSFLDLFELNGFYSTRYGLYGVDFSDNNRPRYPRKSAHWYSTLIAITGEKWENTCIA